jgi:hypothetical protein
MMSSTSSSELFSRRAGARRSARRCRRASAGHRCVAKFLDVGDDGDQPHPLGDAEQLRELAEDGIARAGLEVLAELRPKGGDPILVDHGERQRTEMRPEMVTEDCVVADASRRLLHPHMLRLEALVVEAFEGHLWDGFGYRLWCG